MNKYWGMGLFLWIGFYFAGFSQLQLSFANPEVQFPARSVASFLVVPETTPALSPSLDFIRPRFVRENPRGYSYLCRLELEIEDKLPIGVWLNLGEYTHLPGNSGGNAHLKFKLLDF